jgi:hypothetical protein
MLLRGSKHEEFSDCPYDLPFVDGSYLSLVCFILGIFSRTGWFREELNILLELIFHQTFLKPERRISWGL